MSLVGDKFRALEDTVETQDLRALVLKTMKDRSITAYRISKETGIRESTLSDWFRGQTESIGSCHLEKILAVLDLKVSKS